MPEMINSDVQIPDIKVSPDNIEHVTVVVPDTVILINGIPLNFKFPYQDNLHAIQWDNKAKKGHMEFTDDLNMELDESLFDEEVLPYIKLYAEEQAKQFVAAIQQFETDETEYNSEAMRMERLKERRNYILKQTDFLVLPDVAAGINPQILNMIYKYREKIREIAKQRGAPWDGGESETPWPEFPLEIVKKEASKARAYMPDGIGKPIAPVFTGVVLDEASKEFARKYGPQLLR